MGKVTGPVTSASMMNRQSEALLSFSAQMRLQPEEGTWEMPEDVISAVQGDPYSIGFCKLINVIGFEESSYGRKFEIVAAG